MVFFFFVVQGGQVQQQGYQQLAGFGPNAQPPVFEKVFSNARFAQGGVASFEGRVTGKPQPEVTWARKGAPLLSSNKHRLTYNETTGDITFQINQIGPGDEGEYVCSAKNQYGAAICSVFIQPEGFQMPQRQAFQRHEQTTTYSNGTFVQEDFKIDTFEYRLLREVSFRESITRRFVGETDVQLSTTVERSLGPPAAPQISQKPRNSKLLEGSDAVFSAKVSANPRPRITWFRNGQRITETQKYESSFSNNQATLRVKQASSEDSGHYTLLAENPQGCVVSSAYLAIEPVTTQEGLIHESTFKSQQTEIEQTDTGKTLAPNFVRVCGDRDVTEGKMTRFDCRVTGRPYPEVTWFINGRQVTDDHNHKILVNESGNHALMITTVSRIDSGVVTCVARNKTGETSFQCNLNVIEKEQVVAPKFVERFTTVNVREGEPVLLNARAVGTPTPRITWQKDGVPLSSSHEVRIAIDGGASTLDIPRAKASDAGWYQCTAQNVAGSTATRARLFVETPQGPTQEPRRLHLPRPTKVIEPE
jgi:titin